MLTGTYYNFAFPDFLHYVTDLGHIKPFRNKKTLTVRDRALIRKR